MGKAHNKRFLVDGHYIAVPVSKQRQISNSGKRRRELFAQQKGACAICGGRMTMKHGHSHTCTIDHIRPLSRGGNHGKRNLRGACYECNHNRGNSDAYA